MKHSIRIFSGLLTVLLAAGSFACSLFPAQGGTPEPSAVVEVTPSPVAATPVEEAVAALTPEPVTPLPTPDPTPTPEPTDTPAPTEIPFSYYAPTVNMSFEELVGSLDDFDESNPKSNETFRMPEGYPAPDTYRIIVDLY